MTAVSNGMRKIKLKEVCDRITVGHVGPMADKYTISGVPFLRSQNILPFRLNLDEIKFIPLDFHESLRKSSLRPGDVAVVRTGYPGTACVIPNSFTELNCADLVVITPSSELNPYYLAAIFNSAWGIASVAGNLVGVAQQHFNVGAARELEVSLPLRPVQDRIAGILSAYDELIENNQQRIRILEDMARSLYREWFVHFRYPGHESVPLVDSPLGPIPQGWEVKKIAELLAKVSRQGKIKTQDYLQAGDLPVIDQGRELVGGYTNDADVEYSGELPVIVFGDHTRILKFIDFPFACGADGTQLLRSNDERMPVSLFFYTLSAVELSDFAYARHFKFLKEELVVVPIAEVATAFSERVNPIKRQVRVLQQQSDNLRRTRDLLLPRLLSGQVLLDA